MSGTTYQAERSAFSAIPVGLDVGMAANVAPGEHDLIGLDSSGRGIVLDGTQAGARVLGVHDEKRSTASAIDGQNVVRVWNGYGVDMPMSADSGDAFTSADGIAPAYVSGPKEIGKLGAVGGVARTVAGLFLRLTRSGKPTLWIGDIAQTIARAIMSVDAFTFASYPIADAAANTAITERTIARVRVPGVVETVAYTGAAFAADDTDYVTATLAKRSSADSYATATTIATFDSRAAAQGAASAFTPKGWLLTATAANRRLVPGDVLTLVTVKGGAGKSQIGVIDVGGKVN